MIKKGKMPYAPYLVMHPEARLTKEEKDELIKGLGDFAMEREGCPWDVI